MLDQYILLCGMMHATLKITNIRHTYFSRIVRKKKWIITDKNINTKMTRWPYHYTILIHKWVHDANYFAYFILLVSNPLKIITIRRNLMLFPNSNSTSFQLLPKCLQPFLLYCFSFRKQLEILNGNMYHFKVFMREGHTRKSRN